MNPEAQEFMYAPLRDRLSQTRDQGLVEHGNSVTDPMQARPGRPRPAGCGEYASERIAPRPNDPGDGSGADRIVGAIRPGVRPGDAAYAAMT